MRVIEHRGPKCSAHCITQNRQGKLNYTADSIGKGPIEGIGRCRLWSEERSACFASCGRLDNREAAFIHA